MSRHTEIHMWKVIVWGLAKQHASTLTPTSTLIIDIYTHNAG